MREKLWELLKPVYEFLRWIGKYEESNALISLSRLARHLDLDTAEKFEAWVSAQEESKP